MKKRNLIAAAISSAILLTSSVFAADGNLSLGIVNFSTCISESKYGKNEQEQIETMKKQWVTLIEQTEKELKEIAVKFEDQEFLDGLSPDAEEALRDRQKTATDNLYKYQNQLYQIMNQANYFFMQKMLNNISKAAEKIALEKNFDFIVNNEVCFYRKADMDITDLVIKEMDNNFDEDAQKNKVSQNTAQPLTEEPKELSVEEKK